MSPLTLNRLVNDAYCNNDLPSAIQAYNEWQIANCYYPSRQRIFDSHTQTMHDIIIPCGKCYHCMESKINEWCTRMYAHAEDFKHVYFITLTYRSFQNITAQVHKLILDKYRYAIWHYDSRNSLHRPCWRPCLLVKKHYQDFLKRLRKNTGLTDITYVLSGEYGSEFGAPHFHAILFTNGVLTKDDISRAWSVCLWRKNDGTYEFRKNQKYNGQEYNFPLGRVDFNDLVSNGTFNTSMKVRVDGTYMNAANCFSYVCKYVCKRDDANLSRVHIAYNNLFKNQKYVNVFDKEVCYNIVCDYLRSVGYSIMQTEQTFQQLNSLTYEKNDFVPTDFIYKNGISHFEKRSLYGHEYNAEVYPSAVHEFCNLFRPFCEFSRGTPIGSLYASRNLSQFKEGVFSRPILQTSGFVVPSYFRRKAQNSVYGLRKIRKTLRSSSFVYGGLVDLYRRFSESLETGIPPFEHFNSATVDKSIAETLRHSSRVFRDLSTGENIVLQNGFASHYIYNRHQRDYKHTRDIVLADWLRLWVSKLQDEFSRYDKLQRIAKQNAGQRESAILKMADFGVEYEHLRDRFVQQSALYRAHKDFIYNEVHSSAE